MYGTVFLGPQRSDLSRVHEPGLTQRIPLGILALACLVLGAVPGVVLPWIDRAIGTWAPESRGLPSTLVLVPTEWLLLSAVVVLAVAVGLVFIPRCIRRVTWDCGYAAPTPRMAYTGTSLGQSLLALFRVVRVSRSSTLPRGSSNRGPIHFRLAVPDLILDRLVLPVFRSIGRQVPRFRLFQQGQTQVYILYVFAATLILLALAGWGGKNG
jgi:NADH:ubiquinone oxidoreductase subunit 5 (subunit L)/multisubunit Na+/H+ antiporter MnhA subunit